MHSVCVSCDNQFTWVNNQHTYPDSFFQTSTVLCTLTPNWVRMFSDELAVCFTQRNLLFFLPLFLLFLSGLWCWLLQLFSKCCHCVLAIAIVLSILVVLDTVALVLLWLRSLVIGLVVPFVSKFCTLAVEILFFMQLLLVIVLLSCGLIFIDNDVFVAVPFRHYHCYRRDDCYCCSCHYCRCRRYYHYHWDHSCSLLVFDVVFVTVFFLSLLLLLLLS